MEMPVVVSAVFLGLILIYFEFFIPGGILAFVGAAALLFSIVAFGLVKGSFLAAFLYTIGLIVVVALVCRFALYRIRKSGKKNTFFLEEDQEGYTAASFDPKLIGEIAIVLSDLKPAGRIEVNGEAYQAVSESGYIEKGRQVKILNGKGSYYIVSLI